MAMRVVELTEEELKQSGKRYEKFTAVGDRHRGVLVKIESTTKTFKVEEGPKTFDVYTFYGPKSGDANAPLMFEISPLPFDLERKVKKARRPVSEGGEGLEPGKGHFLDMAYTGNTPDGGMKLFKLGVDTAFTSQKPLPAEVVWAVKATSAAPQNGGQTKPPPDDDIPF